MPDVLPITQEEVEDYKKPQSDRRNTTERKRQTEAEKPQEEEKPPANRKRGATQDAHHRKDFCSMLDKLAETGRSGFEERDHNSYVVR